MTDRQTPSTEAGDTGPCSKGGIRLSRDHSWTIDLWAGRDAAIHGNQTIDAGRVAQAPTDRFCDLAKTPILWQALRSPSDTSSRNLLVHGRTDCPLRGDLELLHPPDQPPREGLGLHVHRLERRPLARDVRTSPDTPRASDQESMLPKLTVGVRFSSPAASEVGAVQGILVFHLDPVKRLERPLTPPSGR